ncbi:MAG TPA: hypothetical protein VFV58_32440 [Blastocatellia bacterium]|jgi:hypothetical protein|nr:hypothetical protein [Blastocatellia bacterium]
MLIQDALTGYLHEIPDHHYGSYMGEYGQLYEPQWGEYPQGYGYSPQYGAGQVVYDGLGNPVGMFPLLTALAPLAAKVLPKLAQRFLPAITSLFNGAPAGPMPDQHAVPPPGPPIPVSMPAPIHPPGQPEMGPMVHPMMRSHHRHRCHCHCRRRFRRHMAVPPPVVMEPIREAGNADPAGAVHGWGYYGGVNGYGQW